jgi:hypothetical protein
MNFLVENSPVFDLFGLGELDFACGKLTCTDFGTCRMNCGTITCSNLSCLTLISPDK